MNVLQNGWNFIQNEVLGMKWLNRVIQNLLENCGLDTSGKIGGSINFFYWGKDKTGKSVVYTYYNTYPVPHLDDVPGVEDAFGCASTNYYDGNMIGYYNLFLNTKRMIKSLRFIRPEGIVDGVSHLVYNLGDSNVVEMTEEKEVTYDFNYIKIQGDYAVATSPDGGCYLVKMPDAVIFKIAIEDE